MATQLNINLPTVHVAQVFHCDQVSSSDPNSNSSPHLRALSGTLSQAQVGNPTTKKRYILQSSLKEGDEMRTAGRQ